MTTKTIIINHDLIDAPEAPSMALPDVEAIRASQAEIGRLVSAAIEAHSANLKAEAQAAVDYAKATADKMLAAMGNLKPKVVGVKFGDKPAVITSGRPHAALPEILFEVHAGVKNIGLTGPRGSGKTTLGKQLAETLGVPFGFISVTLGMSESQLFGRWTPKGEFMPAPLWSMLDKPGVFLLDEMDCGDPNTLLAANSIMANGIAVNPYTGESKTRHPDFIIMGAMNTSGRGATAEYTGRNRLDAATLDRLSLLPVNYDRDLEAELCPFEDLRKALWTARENLELARSKEIIGTRSLQRAAAYRSAGLDDGKIFARLTQGWDSNSVATSGLKVS